MEIKRYESNLLLSNMYIVIEDGHAIVIDPYEDTDPGKGLIVDYILLTHEHYDHISGVKKWKEKNNAKVVCSLSCSKNIVNPRKSFASFFDVFCELQTWIEINNIPAVEEGYVCHADEVFSGEKEIEWMGHSICMFELPGHSMGSIGIIIDNKHFFSGDSLMKDYEIELRMPGGSREQWESIGKPRIDALPDGIMVYPGHFEEFVYLKKRREA